MSQRASRGTSSRRDFLKAASAVIAAPYFVPSRALSGPGRVGANDRVRIGVIGTGVRGKYLIANLPPGGQVVALCDVAMSHIASTVEPKAEFAAPLAPFSAGDAQRCAIHQDYRRMMDREKLDAVMIATPDHHHILAAVLACQAGLDVYCEKPLSLTIAEGRALAHAVKRFGTVLQVGSQQRTMEMNRFACEFIRGGGLGRVSRVELPNYPGPLPIGALPVEPIPPGMNWDMFCGPAPMRPYHHHLWVKEEYKVDGLLWRGWDLYRDYSGHLMSNWGGHSVDMVQYALGSDDTGPIEIRLEDTPVDESLWKPWQAKTPPLGSVADERTDRLRFRPVTMRYANGTELRFTPGATESVFHGEQGTMFIARNKFRAEPADLITDAPDPGVVAKWDGAGHVARPHIENWLECIRSRGVPNAPIEVGHRTATICHLANLARELARPLRWDPVAERFQNDEAANLLLDRPRRAGFELPDIG